MQLEIDFFSLCRVWNEKILFEFEEQSLIGLLKVIGKQKSSMISLIAKKVLIIDSYTLNISINYHYLFNTKKIPLCYLKEYMHISIWKSFFYRKDWCQMVIYVYTYIRVLQNAAKADID